jgi:hypothetical protein
LRVPQDSEIPLFMKPPASFAASAIALAALTGCHRHSGVEYARIDACRANPENVEVFIDQEPSRPYRVIGVVDAPFTIGAGHRMTKMQINACRIGADAIIDESDAPAVARERVLTAWGTVVEERVERPGRRSTRALAIRYTDAAAPPPPPAAPPLPAEPVAPQEEDEAPAATEARTGNIQIQARGVQIQAPSVEFRTLPAAPQAPQAPTQQAPTQQAPAQRGGWTD